MLYAPKTRCYQQIRIWWLYILTIKNSSSNVWKQEKGQNDQYKTLKKKEPADPTYSEQREDVKETE